MPPLSGLRPTPRGAPRFIAACGRQSLLAGTGFGRSITSLSSSRFTFYVSFFRHRQLLRHLTLQRIIHIDEPPDVADAALAVAETKDLAFGLLTIISEDRLLICRNQHSRAADSLRAMHDYWLLLRIGPDR